MRALLVVVSCVTSTALFSTMFFSTAVRADESSRPRVLVLDPTTQAKDDSELHAMARTLGNLVTVELTKDRRLDVITQIDIKRLAELDSDRQALDCNAESCLAELAGAIGAQYVVYGELGLLGSAHVLNLSLFDSVAARAINRVAMQGTVDEVSRGIAKASLDLTSPLVGRPAGAAEGDARFPLFGTIMLISGAALTASALTFDLTSPTGKNQKIDVFDFIGPVGVTVGAALIITPFFLDLE